MDKTILKLKLQQELPEEVYIPAADKDGNVFRFEYKSQTSNTIIQNTEIIENALTYLSTADAELLWYNILQN